MADAVFSGRSCWCCGLITHGTFAGSGDEPHYLTTSYSLAFDGDADLSNNYESPVTLIGGPQGLEAGLHARAGPDGVLRPIHDVGMPLVFAPYVRVAHSAAVTLSSVLPAEWLRRARLSPRLLFRHFISLAMIALTALLAVALRDFFRQEGGTDRMAWWWALLIVLSPPILSHGFLFFTEIGSALVILGGFLRLRRESISTGTAILCGIGIGFLPLLHMRNLPIAAALAIVALRHHARAPKSMLAIAAAAAITFALRTGAELALLGAVADNAAGATGELDRRR